MQNAGHDVLAVAPTRSALEELQKVGFQASMTITRLLQDESAQQRLRGNVLIVDEAGMVSGRQMEGILDLAKREMFESYSLAIRGRFRASNRRMHCVSRNASRR